MGVEKISGDPIVDPAVAAAVEDAFVDLSDLDESRAGQRLGVDPSDFPSFYGRYRTTLRRRASKFLADPCDVDDVVQETFLKVFLALPELDSELAAVRFAHRVLANMCIDRYRTSQRRPRMLVLDGAEDVLSVHDEDPLLIAEDAAIVREALSRLSPEHRSALVKREIEEKALPVIAAEMGVPEESVKHLLFRARRSLRRLLVGTSVDPTIDLTAGQLLEVAGRRAGAAARSGTARGLVVVLLLIVGVAWSTGVGRGPGHSGAPITAGGVRSIIVPTVVAPPARHPAGRHHSGLAHGAGHAPAANSAQVVTHTSITPQLPPPARHHSGGTKGHRPVNPPVTGIPSAPGKVGPFTVSGLGASSGGEVADQDRVVDSAGSYTSSANFVAQTSQGQFSLNQSLSFTASAGRVSATSANLNPVVPQGAISAGYAAADPAVSVTPTAAGYTVVLSGVAQALSGEADAPSVALTVTALYDSTLSSISAEQVTVTVPPSATAASPQPGAPASPAGSAGSPGVTPPAQPARADARE